MVPKLMRLVRFVFVRPNERTGCLARVQLAATEQVNYFPHPRVAGWCDGVDDKYRGAE